MKKILATVTQLLCRKQEGATMVEYSLMLVLIAAVCVATVTTLGTTTLTAFSKMVKNF